MTDAPNPLGEIWARSITDLDFRTRLIDDPRTTLRKEMGLELSDGVTINVVENTDTEYTIVLPDPAAVSGDEEDEVVGFGFTPSIPGDDVGGFRPREFPRPNPGDFGFGSNPFRC